MIVIHSNFLSAMHGFRDNDVLLPTEYDVIVIPPQGALHARPASRDFLWRILKERPWPPDSVPKVSFFLRCMVSEITRFYCKLDMTSSWFCRQGAFRAIFHDGFWKMIKIDHDFQIAFHSNVCSVMHGFRDNEVYWKPNMTSSWFIRQGALNAIFFDGFWKSDHEFLIAFHSNFIFGMHGFRDNEVYCKLDITSPWFLRYGAFQAIFHYGFWKSDHDFLSVVNGNFCPNSNGFEVYSTFSLCVGFPFRQWTIGDFGGKWPP